jgi:hypothetical protein
MNAPHYEGGSKKVSTYINAIKERFVDIGKDV